MPNHTTSSYVIMNYIYSISLRTKQPQIHESMLAIKFKPLHHDCLSSLRSEFFRVCVQCAGLVRFQFVKQTMRVGIDVLLASRDNSPLRLGLEIVPPQYPGATFPSSSRRSILSSHLRRITWTGLSSIKVMSFS